jgi:cytochrome c556
MRRTAALAAAMAAAVALWPSAGAAPADGPDVKEIMGKANKPTGLYYTLARDLKDDEPSWPDVQKEAKELAQLIAALKKATPPRGDKSSWDSLTKAYAADAAALSAAADKKDKKAAQAVHARMGEACDACHDKHKPKE